MPGSEGGWRISLCEREVTRRRPTLHIAAASGPNPTRLQDRHIAGSPRPTCRIKTGQSPARRPAARPHAFEGSRLCDQFRPRSCSRVRIGAQACAGHTPCTKVNTPPATQSVHALRTTSPAQRQRHCRPGRFLFPQGAFRRRVAPPAPWPYNFRNTECSRAAPGASALSVLLYIIRNKKRSSGPAT